MPILDIRGRQLYYRVQGSGVPLILVAGLAQDQSFWDFLLPFLLKDFQVVTFDNRGIGESSDAYSVLTVELLADDVCALVHELGLGDCLILGHSLGAAVAFAVAQRNPDLVRKVVLVSGLYPGPWFVPSSLEALKSVFALYRKDPVLVSEGLRLATSETFAQEKPQVFEALLQKRVSGQSSGPVVYMKQIYAAVRYLQRDHLLKDFPVPLCLVYGKEDRIVHPDNGYRIRFRLPRAQLHFIPRCGHLVPIEKAQVLADIMKHFYLNLCEPQDKGFWRSWLRGFR